MADEKTPEREIFNESWKRYYEACHSEILPSPKVMLALIEEVRENFHSWEKAYLGEVRLFKAWEGNIEAYKESRRIEYRDG